MRNDFRHTTRRGFLAGTATILSAPAILRATRAYSADPVLRIGHVSPRTGRAVSLSAGEPYRDRLLPLPGFLIGRAAADPPAVEQGLALTGHFVERTLFGQAHKPVPPARQRYVERYRKFATTSGILPPR